MKQISFLLMALALVACSNDDAVQTKDVTFLVTVPAEQLTLTDYYQGSVANVVSRSNPDTAWITLPMQIGQHDLMIEADTRKGNIKGFVVGSGMADYYKIQETTFSFSLDTTWAGGDVIEF